MIDLHRTIALLAVVLLATGCDLSGPSESDGTSAGLSGIRYLASDGDADIGFARAIQSREFVFPADHSPHPEFQTEWWYFTGNVFDASGRHYGFELTLFRLALTDSAPAEGSAFSTRDVWMGHLAVTDTRRGRFQAAERLSRGAPGLAGLQRFIESTGETEITLEDWSLRFIESGVRLIAAEPEFGIDLTLTGLDRIVLQGDNGLDRKGPEPGNASYYYSAPRLQVAGSLRSAGENSATVSGAAWLDREWSTSALSSGVDGWDWFALQLDDGSDLMYYRLRSTDGSTSPFSGGSLTSPAGVTMRLDSDSVLLSSTRTWTSQKNGIRYPVAWHISIPASAIELDIAPVLDHQEIDLSARYWEGAVRTQGSRNGSPIAGVGYLELAGY